MMGISFLEKLRLTLARRSCAGCGRGAGVSVWPWSGRVIVTTHVICGACLHAMKPLVARREEVR